ncbi:BTAD domain-containing putative transcriptional regulator, partial [Sporichthya sp.]|uniref:BTAD domain-containing putative transcriptional regulator n=1 Tax=Sporichthya sp. TaxID=65475 RepID=UPI0017E6AA9F
MGTDFEVRLLGPVEVTSAGRPLPIGSAKQQTLLAVLALQVNQVVPLDVLVDELWGEEAPPSAPTTAQSLVSRLRGALRATGAAIEGRHPGYALVVDPACVDSRRFEDLAAQGHALAARDADRASERLRAALACWRGPALAGLDAGAFGSAEVARLEQARLAVTEALAQADLDRGDAGAALAVLEPHVREHPLREGAAAVLMTALYRLGRQADALAAYQGLHRSLTTDLGVEPTPDLVALQGRILRHEMAPAPPRAPTHTELTNRQVSIVGGQSPDPLDPAHAPRLPDPVTTFVGRHAELAELAVARRSARLVSVVGLGGAGKTRLALALAAATDDDEFPDGVWLADLTPMTDPELLAGEVTAALGLQLGGAPDAGPAATAALCRYLSGRRMLLILDNCEQVLAGAAALAHEILRRCPKVQVLATSREVLDVPGEVVFRIPPLSLPADPDDAEAVAHSDAVRLFCERAAATGSGFGLSERNSAAIARICTRLDGIPLALELAAARVPVLGAHALADALDDRFALLTGGSRLAPARHQTLRAAMDWSYELLAPAEASLLTRLSVFPAPFDLAAAAAVGAPRATEIEVLDLLAGLVGKSLVVPVVGADPTPRYRLPETVREYGTGLLDEAGLAEAGRAHRDHYLRRVPGFPASAEDSIEGMRAVAADLEHLHAALHASLDTGEVDQALRLIGWLRTFWHWSGRWAPLPWLERCVAMAERDSPDLSVALTLLSIALDQSHRPDPGRSAALHAEATAVATRLGEPAALAYADFIQGFLRTARGEFEPGRALLVQGKTLIEEVAVENPDSAMVAAIRGWCEYVLGTNAIAAGDPSDAVRWFEAAREAGRGGATVLTAHSLAALAPLAAAAGDPDRARGLAAQAEQLSTALPLPATHALVLIRCAEALLAGDAAARQGGGRPVAGPAGPPRLGRLRRRRSGSRRAADRRAARPGPPPGAPTRRQCPVSRRRVGCGGRAAG